MAILWGNTSNNFRVGIDIKVNSGNSRTIIVYVQSVRYGFNFSTGQVVRSGSWSGTNGFSFSSPHNGTVTKEIYRQTMSWTGARTFRAQARHPGLGINSNVSRGLTITPPSTPNPPGKPGKPSVSRSSDAQHAVSWSGSGTWTGAQIQRETDNGGAQTVASPGGNPRSWTDKTTRGNSRYRWRVRGKNAGGWGSWSDWSNWAYTTPAPPTSVQATKTSNGDIRVAASLPPWATYYDIQDEGVEVGSVVGRASIPWTHSNPSSSAPHRYRMRSRVNPGVTNSSLLTSGWSVYSNTVQLTAPPAAPTDLAPNGQAVDAGEDVGFAWSHNPVDSSEQTAFQVDYREPGGVWASVTGGSDSSVDVDLDAGEYEWRVRTKGTHPDWSVWSATATVEVLDQPGVAIEEPGYDSVIDYSTLNVAWSFFQAQGSPQSAWQVELVSDEDEVLEAREGVDGATNVVLGTRLEDEQEYTVRVRAGSGGLWSDWDEVTFTVEFIPPIPGTLDGSWNDDEGAVDLVVGFTEQPVPAEHRNYAPRIKGDGSPVEIRRNLSRNPAFQTKAGMLSKEAVDIGGGGSYDLDSSWSIAGGMSARIYGGNGGSVALYPIGGRSDCEPIGERAGQTMTVAATCRLAEEQISPNQENDATYVPRGIVIGYVSSSNDTQWVYESVQAPNEVGEHRLAVTFDLPADSGGHWFIRLFNGDSSNQTSIWWDAVTIEEGETDGTYFDGFTDEIGVTAKWEDEPYLSESFLEVEPVEDFVGVGCTPVLAEWEGRAAIKLLPEDENGGYAYFDIPADARAEGTLLATLGVESDLDAGLAPFVESPTQSAGTLPMEAGTHEARLLYESLTGTYRACLPVGDTPVVWSRLGLYEGEYEGVQWDGDTSWVEIDGERLFTKWDDGGGSVTGSPDNPVLVTVERNMGDHWVTIYEAEELGESFITDFEALSNGINEYRVTTWSELGATSEEVFYIPADSGSVWLSGGGGFGTVCRLPYNPQPSRTAGRATSVREYSGRAKPVVYKGRQKSRVVDIAGDVLYDDDVNAAYEDLEELVHLGEPLHLYRDPDGQRVYGALESVSLSRQSHVHWSYSASITEADR